MLSAVTTPSQSSTVCSTSGSQSQEMHSDRRSTDTSVEQRQKKSTKSVDNVGSVEGSADWLNTFEK